MSSEDRFVAVDDAWVGEWTGPAVLRICAGRVAVLRSGEDVDADAVAPVGGVVLPGFCDAHVHLGLVDAGSLVAGGIARVVDLGWDPAIASGWARGTDASEKPGMPEVEFAGAFLTGVGGYPSGRSWAPDAAVRQLGDVAGALAAVTEMHRAGARFVKLVLHADHGREISDEVARAVVDEAHRLGLIVVAHAEGQGQARRAERLGVDRLAHTPWTERLDDDLIAALAARTTWVSTLDIHGWGAPTAASAVALDNLARFIAAGGRVLYGTDLGNGPLPTALNVRELEALVSAGLTAPRLLDALAPLPSRELARSTGEDVIDVGARVSWAPTRAPADVDELPAWLQTARVVAADDLEEMHA
ncbi:amidohydrolase [Herbiconiux sp. UC225_62]|uniref:amidohydrolase family protein n=1 Tax=Herbiconiux sp. UC225_62 TaxID=3350168 RepID=UPI0036D30523